MSARLVLASVILGAAGMLAATAALLLLRRAGRFRDRSAAARFLIALATLVIGTFVIAACLLTLQRLVTYHPIGHIPARLILPVLAGTTAGSLYNLASVVPPLAAPIGLPLAIGVAALMARRPRVEESTRSAMPPLSETEPR